VPHKFKSRTVTVASVVIIFSSSPYALRVTCKIDGFRSKDTYCLSNIMNNKTECELYHYSFPLLQIIGVFFLFFSFRFMVHLQSSSSPLNGNLYASKSQSLLTFSFIPTPYQASSRFFVVRVSRLISSSVRCIPTNFLVLRSPPTFRVLALPLLIHALFVYIFSVHLPCAFI